MTNTKQKTGTEAKSMISTTSLPRTETNPKLNPKPKTKTKTKTTSLDQRGQPSRSSGVVRLSRLVAGSRPLAFVPQTLEEALTLAKAIVASRMAPEGFDTPEACMVAILHGLEVGLTPLMALQRITLVDGRPTLWGDAALALVRASGLACSIREKIEGETPETWTAVCEVLRVGEDEPVARSFTTQDARRAGLWGRPGPWSTYPRRMLQMRARAFALRDVFPDVLGGLYLREEIEDARPADAVPGQGDGCEERPVPRLDGPASPLPVQRPRRVRSGWSRLRVPRDAIRLRAPSPPGYGAPPNPATDGVRPIGPDALMDPLALLDLYDQALCCAQDDATLQEVGEEFAGRLAGLPREVARQAERIRARHEDRVKSLRGEKSP